MQLPGLLPREGAIVSYLDPSILRLRRGERTTVQVHDLRWRDGFDVGEHIEVGIGDAPPRMATVRRWDGVTHELEIEYDLAAD